MGTAARIEGVVSEGRADHRDIRRQQGVQRAHQLSGLEGPGQAKHSDLPMCVNAGVGSSGTSNSDFPREYSFERKLDSGLDRILSGL